MDRNRFGSPFYLLSLLIVLVGGFMLARLRSWQALIYPPGGEFSDLTVTFWPNIYYIKHSLSAFGQLPLWRTLIFSGSPFDIDPQSGLWYPPNLIFLLLPVEAGFNTLILAHLVLGGLGAAIWSRSLCVSKAGSLLAALGYAFAPKFYAHLGYGHVGLVYGSAYIPWVFWSAYQTGKGRWRYAGMLGLTLGFQFLASPQLALLVGVVAGVYALTVSLWSGAETSRFSFQPKHLVVILAAGVLALGVATVQILPMARFAPYSSRSGMDIVDAAAFSLPSRYLLGIFLADHHGAAEYMNYFGLPVLALALFASGRGQGRFWWVVVILSWLYALGSATPLHGAIHGLLPALNALRVPSRVLFISSAALATLAGIGFDRLARGFSSRGLRRLRLAVVGCSGFAICLPFGFWLLLGSPPTNLVAMGLVVPLAGALVLLLASGRIRPGLAAAGLALLILADLWVVDATLIEGRPADQVFADQGAVAYLAGQPVTEPFRVYSPSYSLPRHAAALAGIETADGVDPLYLKEYDEWMQAASGVIRERYSVTVPAMEGDGPVQLANREALPRPDLLGLLNVRYVAAEYPLQVAGLRHLERIGATYLYENELYQPRAYLLANPPGVEAVSGFNGEVQRMPDEAHSLTWIANTPNRLELEVSLAEPATLVISQNSYPGWQAEVDGRPQSITKVYGLFPGLSLQDGTHRVRLEYQPVTLYWGAGISTIAILVCLILVIKRFQS